MSDGPKKKPAPRREGTLSAQPEHPIMAELREQVPDLYHAIRGAQRGFREQYRIFESNPAVKVASILGVNPRDLTSPEGLFSAMIGPFGKGKAFLHDLPEAYGRRELVAGPPKGLKSYVAVWSNNAANWFVSRGQGPIKRGKKLNLDANETVIYARNMREAEEALTEAPTLPLYGGSFEARARQGEFGKELQRERGLHVEKSLFASGKTGKFTQTGPSAAKPGPEPTGPPKLGVVQGEGKTVGREQKILNRIFKEREEAMRPPPQPNEINIADPTEKLLNNLLQKAGIPEWQPDEHLLDFVDRLSAAYSSQLVQRRLGIDSRMAEEIREALNTIRTLYGGGRML